MPNHAGTPPPPPHSPAVPSVPTENTQLTAGSGDMDQMSHCVLGTMDPAAAGLPVEPGKSFNILLWATQG